MQVFLIRHADAIADTGVRDELRHLTSHGRDQARELGDRLRWHDCVPTCLLTSPLVRAVQTAELIASGIESNVPVEVELELAPEGNARRLAERLRALPATSVVVLVGHEPGLATIGALVTGAVAFATLGRAEALRIVDGRVKWRFAWDAEAPSAER